MSNKIQETSEENRKEYAEFSKLKYEEKSPYIIWDLIEILNKSSKDRISMLKKKQVFSVDVEWDLVWSVTLSPSSWKEFSHLIQLGWLYVLEPRRRKWYAKLLMEHVDNRIVKSEEYEKCTLMVRSDNMEAIELYSSLWWRLVWEYEKEWKIGEKYYDESIFEKVYQK